MGDRSSNCHVTAGVDGRHFRPVEEVSALLLHVSLWVGDHLEFVRSDFKVEFRAKRVLAEV